MFCARRILEGAVIELGTKADYDPFAALHYRRGSLGVVDKVFTLSLPGYGKIAVIVYSYAPAHLAPRRHTLGHLLPAGASRRGMMDFINANIRIISRVVVLPEFRGASLAAYLVRNTLEKVDVGIIEAVAAMGQFNCFFEKAGMRMYLPPLSERHKLMAAALHDAEISDDMLVDVENVYHRIIQLPDEQRLRLERRINTFLGAYGGKRKLDDARQRIACVLTKICSTAYFYHITDRQP